MRLTDKQWALLAPLFTPPEMTTTRGRPRGDNRAVLAGIFWMLRIGAQWVVLPREACPQRPPASHASIEMCFQRIWGDSTSNLRIKVFSICARHVLPVLSVPPNRGAQMSARPRSDQTLYGKLKPL